MVNPVRALRARPHKRLFDHNPNVHQSSVMAPLLAVDTSLTSQREFCGGIAGKRALSIVPGNQRDNTPSAACSVPEARLEAAVLDMQPHHSRQVDHLQI